MVSIQVLIEKPRCLYPQKWDIIMSPDEVEAAKSHRPMIRCVKYLNERMMGNRLILQVGVKLYRSHGEVNYYFKQMLKE